MWVYKVKLILSPILIDLHYLPCIRVFQHLAQADTVILEAWENFQKGSYRNRCHIVGANGLLRLSIPLQKGKHQQLPIKDVKLSFDEPWHRQHWQSIRSAYGNAPFFPFYEDLLSPIFVEPGERLWDFNKRLLLSILECLQLEVKVEESVEYIRAGFTGIDLRGHISPKMRYESLATASYPQVFSERHGFMPNLSILDVLFCQGPQASLYLHNLSN